MKTRSSKTKVSYACLSPSPNLSYTITKKKRTFCDAEVIEVPEALAVLLGFSLAFTVIKSSLGFSVTGFS